MRRVLLSLAVVLTACGSNRTFVSKDAYVPGQVEPLSCVPNLDGKIEGTELQAAVGVPVRYLSSPPGIARAVSLAGDVNDQGQREWDLGTDYADDRVATLEASDLAGHWFASYFPNGQFVSALDLGGTTLGVYQHDGSNLLLLGYASSEENPALGQTRVVYSSPVALYKFPLEVGNEWVSVGQVVNAVIRGLPYAGRDTYQMKVESSGVLTLPDVTFTQALRVRTTTTIEPAVGNVIVRRQTGWLFECYGEVARATAADGETNDNFTTTSELRRLGF